MSQSYNYRHLYYFWVVAKEGGLTRGAERLGLAVQTLSSQVRELEKALGHALFKPAGRGLALTDAGKVALHQAEQIFQLGEQLPELVREAVSEPRQRLAVGISNELPKLVVRRLLQPVLGAPHLRLLCHEDRFDDLLADLALHRLDVVLADRAAPANPNMRLYSHPLGHSRLAWFAPEAWVAEVSEGFPKSLAHVPVLLPSAHASTRARLEGWFELQGIRPHVVGEFEDHAMMATFGSGGMGVFPAAEVVRDKLSSRYGLQCVGPCEGVDEHFFAIVADKKLAHPLVSRLLSEPLPAPEPVEPSGQVKTNRRRGR